MTFTIVRITGDDYFVEPLEHLFSFATLEEAIEKYKDLMEGPFKNKWLEIIVEIDET